MAQSVIDFLNRRDGFDEAAVVTTYHVYVHSRPVTVQVFDHGEGVGNLRYSVAAFYTGTPEEERHTASGKYTLGNPEATLEMALHGPHWSIFKPED